MRRTWSLNWIIYYFLQMYLRAGKDVTKNVFDAVSYTHLTLPTKLEV